MNPNPLIETSSPVLKGALVDLDATVFLVIGIFLLFYLLLRFALFRPVLRLLDERQARIEGTRKLAQELREKAMEATRQYEALLKEARAQGAELKLSLRQEGQRLERELVDEVRRETEAQLVAGKAELQAEMERAAAELEREVAALSRAAAARLLGRPVGPGEGRRTVS
jgi:F-type H+-transporting ATPase subunit b